MHNEETSSPIQHTSPILTTSNAYSSRNARYVIITESERDKSAGFDPKQWGVESLIEPHGGEGIIYARQDDDENAWADAIVHGKYEQEGIKSKGDVTQPKYLYVIILIHGDHDHFRLRRRFGFGHCVLSKRITRRNLMRAGIRTGYKVVHILDTSCAYEVSPSNLGQCNDQVNEWDYVFNTVSDYVNSRIQSSDGSIKCDRANKRDDHHVSCKCQIKEGTGNPTSQYWESQHPHRITTYNSDDGRGIWYLIKRNGIVEYISAATLHLYTALRCGHDSDDIWTGVISKLFPELRVSTSRHSAPTIKPMVTIPIGYENIFICDLPTKYTSHVQSVMDTNNNIDASRKRGDMRAVGPGVVVTCGFPMLYDYNETGCVDYDQPIDTYVSHWMMPVYTNSLEVHPMYIDGVGEALFHENASVPHDGQIVPVIHYICSKLYAPGSYILEFIRTRYNGTYKHKDQYVELKVRGSLEKMINIEVHFSLSKHEDEGACGYVKLAYSSKRTNYTTVRTLRDAIEFTRKMATSVAR